MKKKVALFGEELLSGIVYDTNQNLMSYKSSCFNTKIFGNYLLENYSMKKMDSAKALELMQVLAEKKYKFKKIIIQLGQNEAELQSQNLEDTSILQNFESNLIAMVQLCKKRKIAPTLIDLPSKDEVYAQFSEIILYVALSYGAKLINCSKVFKNEVYTLQGQEKLANKLFLEM